MRERAREKDKEKKMKNSSQNKTKNYKIQLKNDNLFGIYCDVQKDRADTRKQTELRWQTLCLARECLCYVCSQLLIY